MRIHMYLELPTGFVYKSMLKKENRQTKKENFIESA